jgi:hypothetical protein
MGLLEMEGDIPSRFTSQTEATETADQKAYERFSVHANCLSAFAFNQCRTSDKATVQAAQRFCCLAKADMCTTHKQEADARN